MNVTMKNLKILIVDDDKEWVDIFCANLETLSTPAKLAGGAYDRWEFHCVTNQRDANRAAKTAAERPYDLVILDLLYPLVAEKKMPIERDTKKPLQGMMWLPELRRLQPKATIVIATSFPEENDMLNVVQAIRQHADDFVPKSAGPETICSRLALAIQHQRQEQRLLLLEQEMPTLSGVRAAIVIAQDFSDALTKHMYRMDRIAQRIESGDSSAISAAPDSIRAESSSTAEEYDKITTMVDRRLSSGHRKPESVDLVQLIDDLLLLYDRRLEQAGASASGPALLGKAVVRTFVSDLKSALHEVIVNAIEAMACSRRTKKGNRKLDISIAAQNGNVVIQVEDNGDGFSDVALTNLFQKGKTGRNPQEHVGLGLYIARRAMTALGGDIKAEPRPDRGARVKLFIPRPKEPQKP